MPNRPTHLICRVETTNICNQSAGFRLWWVGSRLEFSQPASGGLDRNIGVYLTIRPAHTSSYDNKNGKFKL